MHPIAHQARFCSVQKCAGPGSRHLYDSNKYMNI